MIVNIPIEFYRYFAENPERATLEYLSIPAGATNPFFRNTEALNEAMRKGYSIAPMIDEDTYLISSDAYCNDNAARYMHIDLAINRDGVGISMAHAVGYEQKMTRLMGEEEYSEIEVPIIAFDFVARLKPRVEYGEREMAFDAILALIEELEFKRNYNLSSGLITFDRFQSHHMISSVRSLGIPTGLLSVDATTSLLKVDFSRQEMVRKVAVPREPSAAMGSLRDALYESRLILPQMSKADLTRTWVEKEIDESQFDPDKQKVVKVEGGSDDVIQSVAGSVFNCVNNATDMGFMPDENEAELDHHFDGRIGLPLEDEYTNEDGYVEDDYSTDDTSSTNLSIDAMLGN